SSWCVNETQGYGAPRVSRNITSDYTSPSTGSSSRCGVAEDGTGFCRTLGNAASTGNAAIPPDLWQRLESGVAHQCGLRPDGTLECWGDNTQGQTTNVPTGVLRAFSVGWNHACAIRDNGQQACWGSNLNGQATPPAGTYVQVAAGNTFTCAIRSDGVRACWGDDAHGQAPQLQLTPTTVVDGLVGTAHAGANFLL